MLETLIAIVFGGEPTCVYGCRRCGTNVDSTVDTCPTCGHETICAYVIV